MTSLGEHSTIRVATSTLSLRALAASVVAASVVYLALLCFANTNVIRVNNAMVAIADAAIVVAALGLAFNRYARTLTLIALALVAFFCLQRLFTPELAIKPVRDILAAVAFLFLGKAYGDPKYAQNAILGIGAVVVVVGLWEYLHLPSYVQAFNVRDFYIARGVTDPDVIGSGDLFTSAMRPFDRTLLPFLGQHRVSSVFLEPVSMGNFGAIVAAWALSRGSAPLREAVAPLLIAAFAIIIADARFAAGAVALFLVARLVPLAATKALILIMPLVAIAILIAMGAAFDPHGDTLVSRFAHSGQAIAALTLPELLGADADGVYSTEDSGYYYVLKSFGAPFALALWVGFAFLSAPSADAARLKFFIAIYACLLLCVSSASLFALKTAGLAWFLLGASIAAAPRGRAYG